MENKKDNIILKYTIGLSLITIIVLIIQINIIKLFNVIGLMITPILIGSTIILPFLGLYLVTKINCKNSNINHSGLLWKIFAISIVLTILSSLYLGFRLHLFGIGEHGMRSIS